MQGKSIMNGNIKNILKYIMSTGCKQQVMTSRPVKASHKLKTSTGLPPLVSPRMEQIKKS